METIHINKIRFGKNINEKNLLKDCDKSNKKNTYCQGFIATITEFEQK